MKSSDRVRASARYHDLQTNEAAFRSRREVRKCSTFSRTFSSTWSGDVGPAKIQKRRSVVVFGGLSLVLFHASIFADLPLRSTRSNLGLAHGVGELLDLRV
ncbi:hypothetical protein L6164_030643 [Bauhinia variegata]|uniref:Uncharacterized protein n=1 Tax=Bauhinia variegata TaxID=167791 RepID=A0ACB9LCJ5_BAUVA|nr:hypothetical protein L6164_030643 [Bauhinia variegata]